MTQSAEGFQMWCVNHWTKVREGDDVNGIAASLRMFELLVAHEPFMRRCGWEPGTPANQARLHDEARKVQPICCFLGDEAVEKAIAYGREVGVGGPPEDE